MTTLSLIRLHLAQPRHEGAILLAKLIGAATALVVIGQGLLVLVGG